MLEELACPGEKEKEEAEEGLMRVFGGKRDEYRFLEAERGVYNCGVAGPRRLFGDNDNGDLSMYDPAGVAMCLERLGEFCAGASYLVTPCPPPPETRTHIRNSSV